MGHKHETLRWRGGSAPVSPSGAYRVAPVAPAAVTLEELHRAQRAVERWMLLYTWMLLGLQLASFALSAYGAAQGSKLWAFIWGFCAAAQQGLCVYGHVRAHAQGRASMARLQAIAQQGS